MGVGFALAALATLGALAEAEGDGVSRVSWLVHAASDASATIQAPSVRTITTSHVLERVVPANSGASFVRLRLDLRADPCKWKRSMSSKSSIAVAALLLLVACDKPKDAAAQTSSSAAAPAPAQTTALVGRRVDVTATNDGYSPSTISAKKGEDLVLRFTRKTKSECLSEVVFPTLNIKKELPVDQTVEIAVKADKEGTIPFQCGMAMVKGKIEVGS